jgi:hypothetical protein
MMEKWFVCLFVGFFTAQQHTRAIIVPIKLQSEDKILKIVETADHITKNTPITDMYQYYKRLENK